MGNWLEIFELPRLLSPAHQFAENLSLIEATQRANWALRRRQHPIGQLPEGETLVTETSGQATTQQVRPQLDNVAPGGRQPEGLADRGRGQGPPVLRQQQIRLPAAGRTGHKAYLSRQGCRTPF
jgi:hypothetical protein